MKYNKQELLDKFEKLLDIFQFDGWHIKLEFIEKNWKNTGNVKVDVEDKTAIVYLNIFNPKMENLEQVLIHELCHIKLWKLDQYCESLLDSTFDDKNSPAYKFAYDQFMLHLEQTTEEIARTYTRVVAENKEWSFGRCEQRMSYREKDSNSEE